MAKKTRPDERNTVSQAAAARILERSQERVRQLIAAGRLIAYTVEGWSFPRLLRADVEAFKRRRERDR